MNNFWRNCQQQKYRFDNYRRFMKRGNFNNRLAHAGVIGAMAFACFCQPAVAAEAAKDISKAIVELRSNIVSAEVLLTARNREARHANEEKDLERMAWKYKVSGKDDVDSLFDIIANAGIVEAPGPLDDYDARIGVYLHTKDGSTVKLVTGLDDEPATGMFNGTTPVTLKKSIEADLRIWAARHQSSKTPSIAPH